MKLLPLLVFLVGCQAKTTNPDPSDHPSQFYDRRHIEIVILEDGTRCAVAMYPGGMSCDWSRVQTEQK